MRAQVVGGVVALAVLTVCAGACTGTVWLGGPGDGAVADHASVARADGGASSSMSSSGSSARKDAAASRRDATLDAVAPQRDATADGAVVRKDAPAPKTDASATDAGAKWPLPDGSVLLPGALPACNWPANLNPPDAAPGEIAWSVSRALVVGACCFSGHDIDCADQGVGQGTTTCEIPSCGECVMACEPDQYMVVVDPVVPHRIRTRWSIPRSRPAVAL